jgi:hypothetical protein
MRLRAIGRARPRRRRDLSFGLNVDDRLPRRRAAVPLATTPLAARPAIAQAALAAIPPAQYAPFDGQTVLRTSYVDDCLQWPNDRRAAAVHRPAARRPGAAARRPPRPRARRSRTRARRDRELPHASVVDAAGQRPRRDRQRPTGCIARATVALSSPAARWATRAAGADNGFRRCRAAASLGAFRSAPGVGGVARARAVRRARHRQRRDHHRRAARGPAARRARRRPARRALPLFDAGLALSDDALRVRPGLRLTGTLRAGDTDITGRLHVHGPRGTSGFVASPRAAGRPGASAAGRSRYRARRRRAAARATRGRPAGRGALPAPRCCAVLHPGRAPVVQ